MKLVIHIISYTTNTNYNINNDNKNNNNYKTSISFFKVFQVCHINNNNLVMDDQP